MHLRDAADLEVHTAAGVEGVSEKKDEKIKRSRAEKENITNKVRCKSRTGVCQGAYTQRRWRTLSGGRVRSCGGKRSRVGRSTSGGEPGGGLTGCGVLGDHVRAC